MEYPASLGPRPEVDPKGDPKGLVVVLFLGLILAELKGLAPSRGLVLEKGAWPEVGLALDLLKE